MSDLKTKPTDKSPEDFLNEISEEEKRKDCFELLKMMSAVTKSKAVMWGPAIIGFGQYRYKNASGRENDWFLVGFSPRKQNISIYIMAGFKNYEALMKKLGKYKTGASCLYIKKLSDVDKKVLKELMEESVKFLKSRK